MEKLPDNNINHEEIDSLIRFARAYCAERLPWFSPALFNCQIELTKQVPLAAIDQNLNIYFNPESVQKIADAGDMESTLSQLGFVWIHEISHILREHGDRAKEYNAKHMLWNIAADLEINDSQWEGLAPPEIFPLLFPETYDLPPGQLTEYYYQKLQEQEEEKKKKKKEQQEGNKQSDDSPQNPGDQTESDNPGDNDSDTNQPNDQNNPNNKDKDKDNKGNKDQDPQQPNDQHPDDQKNEHPDEGSGVHGTPREWELEQQEEGEKTPVQIQNGKQEKDGMEVEMIRKQVAQAMEEQKAQGNIPGGWERWAENHLKPTINWKQVLKHRMNIAISKGRGSRVDYSYSRPSRRQDSHGNFILPSLRGEVAAKIAVVVDTSGSIKDNELARIMGEIMGVLESYTIPITIIPCDARAYAPIELVTTSDLVKLKKLPGGGGTNMVLGIEAALQLKPKPDSILVLTDGFTPYPQKLYSTPVLFGILKAKNRFSKRPPNPPWRDDLVILIDVVKG